MQKRTLVLKGCIYIFFATVLTACVGGGGDAETAPESTPESTPEVTNLWTKDEYLPSLKYKDMCKTPRLGKDVYGDAYEDKLGNWLDESFWLRSWTNETYLWYDEVEDKNPALYNSPESYFETLKTFQKTITGQDKDKYHFTRSTESFDQVAQTGVSFSHGFNWVMHQSRPPRHATVSYVTPNSPASEAGFARGDTFVKINEVDVKEGRDYVRLNDGFFPTDNDPTHTFTMQRINGTEYTVSMSGADLQEPPVFLTDTITANDEYGDPQSIAYVMLNTFNTFIAEKALFDTFKQLSTDGNNYDTLVLDLRYNSGGYIYIASQLGYMLSGNKLDPNAYFYKETQNDKLDDAIPEPFYHYTSDYHEDLDAGQKISSLNLEKVYVLTTSDSCSASEMLINSLRGANIEVILIGGQTCGKPYGFYSTDNCGTTYSTIQFKAENYKNFGDYADGFIPTLDPDELDSHDSYVEGCKVEDDFEHALGDQQESLLSAAIHYHKYNECPVDKENSQQTQGSAYSAFFTEKPTANGDADLFNDPRMKLHNNRGSNAIMLKNDNLNSNMSKPLTP